MVKLLIVSPDDKSLGIYRLLNAENGEQIDTTLAADPVAALCQLNIKDYSDQFDRYKIMFVEEQSDIFLTDLLQRNKKWNEYINGYTPTNPTLN